MTPDTLVIDRLFKGVGRIKVRTGSLKPDVRRRMSDMLTDLFPERIDVLRAIRDRQVSIVDVYAASKVKGGIERLPLGALSQRLSAGMKKWIDGLETDGPSPDCSVKHKESLETSRRYFERESPDATLADLPAVLEALRESLGKKHPRSFNLTRTAALRYVRATLKKNHPLWLECAAVEHRKVKRTTKRTPLTPEQLRNFFPNRDTDWIDGIAWGMATNGMHGKEYWGDWNVQPDRIHIEGTKTDGRRRDVPLVFVPPAPKYNRRKFEDDLRARTRAITVYDLRRTYANLMESAGIPRTRRKIYLGHGPGDITGIYELHEVKAHLIEDAAKLAKLLDFPTPKVTRVRLLKKGTTA